jgi:CDP-6-deoxy-D-xylo-4-hexulose-3-dehydrase
VFTGNILRQPGFKNCAHKASANGYPEADKVMRGGMLMACHHGLRDEQISHVMESVTEFMKSL